MSPPHSIEPEQLRKCLGWRAAFLNVRLISQCKDKEDYEALWWIMDDYVAGAGGQYGGMGWQELPSNNAKFLQRWGHLAFAAATHLEGADPTFTHGPVYNFEDMQPVVESPALMLTAALQRGLTLDASAVACMFDLAVLRTVGPLFMPQQSRNSSVRPPLAGIFDDSAACWAGLLQAVRAVCTLDVPGETHDGKPSTYSGQLHESIVYEVAQLHSALEGALKMLEHPLPAWQRVATSPWSDCTQRSDQQEQVRAAYEAVLRCMVVCCAPDGGEGGGEGAVGGVLQQLTPPTASDDTQAVLEEGVFQCARVACAAGNVPAVQSLLACSVCKGWGHSRVTELVAVASRVGHCALVQGLLGGWGGAQKGHIHDSTHALRVCAAEGLLLSGITGSAWPVDVSAVLAASPPPQQRTLLLAAVKGGGAQGAEVLRAYFVGAVEDGVALLGELLVVAAGGGHLGTVQALLEGPLAEEVTLPIRTSVLTSALQCDAVKVVLQLLPWAEEGGVLSAHPPPPPAVAMSSLSLETAARLVMRAVQHGARQCVHAMLPSLQGASAAELCAAVLAVGGGSTEEAPPGAMQQQAIGAAAKEVGAYDSAAALEAAMGALAVIGEPGMHWAGCVLAVMDGVPTLAPTLLELLLRSSAITRCSDKVSYVTSPEKELVLALRDHILPHARRGRLDFVLLLLRAAAWAPQPGDRALAAAAQPRAGVVQDLHATTAPEASRHGHMHVFSAVVERGFVIYTRFGCVQVTQEQLWEWFINGCAVAALPRDLVVYFMHKLRSVRVDSPTTPAEGKSEHGTAQALSGTELLCMLFQAADFSCIDNARGTPQRLHVLAICLEEVQLPSAPPAADWASLQDRLLSLHSSGAELSGVAAQAALDASDGLDSACAAVALLLSALHPELARTAAHVGPLFRMAHCAPHQWMPAVRTDRGFPYLAYTDLAGGEGVLWGALQSLDAFAEMAGYQSSVKALMATMYRRLLLLHAGQLRRLNATRPARPVVRDDPEEFWLDNYSLEEGLHEGNWRLRRTAVLTRAALRAVAS